MFGGKHTVDTVIVAVCSLQHHAYRSTWCRATVTWHGRAVHGDELAPTWSGTFMHFLPYRRARRNYWSHVCSWIWGKWFSVHQKRCWIFCRSAALYAYCHAPAKQKAVGVYQPTWGMWHHLNEECGIIPWWFTKAPSITWAGDSINSVLGKFGRHWQHAVSWAAGMHILACIISVLARVDSAQCPATAPSQFKHFLNARRHT